MRRASSSRSWVLASISSSRGNASAAIDRERVIPADPELVAVLARIIRRIKNGDGKVP